MRTVAGLWKHVPRSSLQTPLLDTPLASASSLRVRFLLFLKDSTLSPSTHRYIHFPFCVVTLPRVPENAIYLHNGRNRDTGKVAPALTPLADVFSNTVSLRISYHTDAAIAQAMFARLDKMHLGST